MDTMRDLLTNGFIIYLNSSGKFLVRKESVPTNTLIIKEQEVYDTYDLAIEAAILLLKTPQIITWDVIVRYNRGLGIEYLNAPSVVASDKNRAKIMAEIKVAEMFDPSVKIDEIRVRPKIH